MDDTRELIKNQVAVIDVPVLSADAKSVRTTVSQRSETKEIMKQLRERYGLKPKEVIDSFLQYKKSTDSAIEIAKKNSPPKKSRKDQTTIVISRGALNTLKRLSEEHQISRDYLVELIFIIMQIALERDEEERQKKHCDVAKVRVSKALRYIEKIEDELREELGESDPVTYRFGYVAIILMNLYQAIEAELSDGTPIDPDDFSQSC